MRVAASENSDEPRADEQRRIVAAQHGDRPAFAQLVESYWDRLYRWLYHLTHDRHTAEDLTQETFLKAFAGLKKFQAGTNFGAWLFRIAHNNFANQCRTTARRREPLPDNLPDPRRGPFDAAVSAEELRGVARAIERLPTEFRAALLLRSRARAVVPGDRRGPRPDRRDGPLARLQGPAEVAERAGPLSGTGEVVNCTVIQRRLLTAEQPDQPAADVQGHLDQCPACRAWQRRLVQVERQIPLLPVPPSTAKAELLQRILDTGPRETVRSAVAERPTLPRSPLAPGPKERALRKLSVAFALAAALLVFALGWSVWPHNPGTAPLPPSLTLQQLDQKKLDERLASAMRVDKPQDRLLKLADLAENVHGEANAMADNVEKLDQWARFYARVVSENLMEQARQLPRADRPAVLEKVAERLTRTESDASRRAIQLKDTSPKPAAAFGQIALVARKGGRDLRALLRG